MKIYNFHFIFALFILSFFSCQTETTNDKLKDIVQDKELSHFFQTNELDNLDEIHQINFYNTFLNSLESNWDTIPEFIKSKPDFIQGLEIQKCGTYDNNPIETKRSFNYSKNRIAGLFFDNLSLEIPVKIHFLCFSGTNGGCIKKEEEILPLLVNQIKILNDAFASSDISFTLDTSDINFVYDDTYFQMDIGVDSLFDELLHQIVEAPKNYMNIVITKGGILGKATMPAPRPPDDYVDGVAIHFRTIPNIESYSGQKRYVYSYGKTLIHEVGHYLGLYHTFNMNEAYCKNVLKKDYCPGCDSLDQGHDGCDDFINNRKYINGDLISDTPSQRFCHFDNCIQKNGFVIDCNKMNFKNCDTCKRDSLHDPLDNYMGYTNDECMTRFTKKQIIRIKEQTKKHRENFIKGRLDYKRFYGLFSAEIENENSFFLYQ